MALSASTVWEVRANGNANNGGGFTSGGTDHTQQDSAFASRTDLVIGSAGSEDELSSVADNFAADDVGNLIQITAGTNFTVGFYEVLSVAAGVATMDRNVGTADATSGTGALGGAVTLTDNIIEPAIAGNIYWVKNDGTHTLIAAISTAVDGSVTDPIKIKGYNTTRDDNPTTTNRPTIAAAANTFELDNNWEIENFIFTTTHGNGLDIDTRARVINIKSTNSSGSGSRAAVRMGGTGGVIFKCELICTAGEGIEIGLRDIIVDSCYIHDCVDGVQLTARDECTFLNNVFDTCSSSGIEALSAGATNIYVKNNTFYNCGNGIRVNDGPGWTIINNIFDANTVGVEWTAAVNSTFMDYNVWDNTTDVTNVTKGPNAVTGDPGLTDPANGDFTLGDGSNAIDVGVDASSAGATV